MSHGLSKMPSSRRERLPSRLPRNKPEPNSSTWVAAARFPLLHHIERPRHLRTHTDSLSTVRMETCRTTPRTTHLLTTLRITLHSNNILPPWDLRNTTGKMATSNMDYLKYVVSLLLNKSLLISIQRPPSQQQYAQPPPTATSWQQPQPQGYGAADGSVEKLNSDISNLITVSKADFAQNPWDSSIQTRLKALLDLQTILQSQKLPPDQIALIENQVAQLSAAAQPSSKMQTPPAPVPPTPVAAAQQPAPQPFLGLSPEALAALSRQSATPQPVPQSHHAAPIRSPQPSHSQPLYQPPPSNAPASAPVANPGSLLEQLRARGLLPGTPATTSTPTPLNAGAGNLPPGFPPPFTNTPPNASRTPLADMPNDVVLKPASLKLYANSLSSNHNLC